MITEHDLQEAIAECQGVRNPTSSTCIKLAAFLTLKEHLFPSEKHIQEPMYSFASEPVENMIDYYSDTEFSKVIDGKKQADVWPVIDELMTAIQVLNPKLYASVIRKL